MKLPPFELRIPRDLNEALGWRAALGSDAQVLAGGQSLLPMMRYRMLSPHALIDISKLAELRSLTAEPDLRVGAAVTHADLEHCRQAGAVFDLLRTHAREIAFFPVRNKGTVVGSLVHADPAADWPMLFCALDASVEIASVRGRRHVRVVDFIRGAMDTDVQVDEIVVSVSLPARSRQIRRWGRHKLMHRVGEYAMACAVAIQYDDGEWACWLGSVDPFALALPRCAQTLAKAARNIAGAGLVEQVTDEIRAARPACNELAAARHASALSRAVKAAFDGDAP